MDIHPANDPVFSRIPAETRDLVISLWDAGDEIRAEAILNEAATYLEDRPEPPADENYTQRINRERAERRVIDRIANARARSGIVVPENTTGAVPLFLHEAARADAPAY